jgi:ubiquinone/menaquinone biosynthesis C-methylase UbiE
MYKGREFYEKEFHYDEDVVIIDTRRIKHFFRNIRFKEAHTYLDIGCGVGWALRYCHEKGIKCVGFDIAERSIRLAKEKNIISDDMDALIADGEELPFSDKSFDLVSSLGSIEHFSSPARGLEEIYRVTKKKGQILLIVPNSYWILNKLKFYKGTEQPQEMLATIGKWARFIQQKNLRVEKIGKDIGPKIFKNKKTIGIIKRFLLKFTIFLPVSFAYQFVFVCRKR